MVLHFINTTFLPVCATFGKSWHWDSGHVTVAVLLCLDFVPSWGQLCLLLGNHCVKWSVMCYCNLFSRPVPNLYIKGTLQSCIVLISCDLCILRISCDSAWTPATPMALCVILLRSLGFPQLSPLAIGSLPCQWRPGPRRNGPEWWKLVGLEEKMPDHSRTGPGDHETDDISDDGWVDWWPHLN